MNYYNGNSKSGEETRNNVEKNNISNVPDVQKSDERYKLFENGRPTELHQNVSRTGAITIEPISETVNIDSYKDSSKSRTDANPLQNIDDNTEEMSNCDVQFRDISPASSVEPDDDNLKVGSPKYKVFLDNLNKKLSRYTVIPTYLSQNTKSKQMQDADQRDGLKQDDIKPNENVLEESINTAVAREKLLAFINASHSSPGAFRKEESSNFEFPEMKGEGRYADDIKVAVESESKKYKQDVDASTSQNKQSKSDSGENVQHNPNSYALIREKPNGMTVDRIEDESDDYSLHKNRMQNVFRSVNLKRKDSVVSDVSEVKGNTIASISTDKRKEHMCEIFNNNTTNVEEAPSVKSNAEQNDYTLHKTRMQNVFRSVNLKRKDSLDTKNSESERKSKTISEDKVKHRQAMTDIFRTINLKRKYSTDLLE
nr:unnamed protein product [Callosobruchus analis]